MTYPRTRPSLILGELSTRLLVCIVGPLAFACMALFALVIGAVCLLAPLSPWLLYPRYLANREASRFQPVSDALLTTSPPDTSP